MSYQKNPPCAAGCDFESAKQILTHEQRERRVCNGCSNFVFPVPKTKCEHPIEFHFTGVSKQGKPYGPICEQCGDFVNKNKRKSPPDYAPQAANNATIDAIYVTVKRIESLVERSLGIAGNSQKS